MTHDQDAFTRDGFMKGYTEAMLAEYICWRHGRKFYATIADLSDDTKAAILKDCADVLSLAAHADLRDSAPAGREFWERRQAGRYDPAIAPPQTFFLDDKGKVRLSLKETR